MRIRSISDQPTQVVYGGPYPPGGQPVATTVQNNDPVHYLYISDTQEIDPSALAIPPGGAASFDGTQDFFASTLDPVITVQTFTLEGVSGLGGIPSGGAPNLSFKRQIGSPVATTPVTTALANVYDFAGINGTSYDLNLVAWSAGAAQLNITFTWTDSLSGDVISTQNWWIIPGSAAGFENVIHGTGPVEGDQLTITLTAYGGTVNAGFTFFQNSRSTSRHDLRSIDFDSNNSGINTAASDLTELVVGEVSHGLSGGAQTGYLLPLFAGRVRISGQTTSHTNDAQLELFTYADQNLGSSQIQRLTSDSAGNWNLEFSLPRIQCELLLVNNNGGTQTLSAGIIAEEY